MPDKTVLDAAKKLPERAREPFVKAFDACGVQDIYNGDIAQYMEVIRGVVRERNLFNVRMVRARNVLGGLDDAT